MRKPSMIVKTLILTAVLICLTVTSPIHAGTPNPHAALTAGNAPVMTQLTPEQIQSRMAEMMKGAK